MITLANIFVHFVFITWSTMHRQLFALCTGHKTSSGTDRCPCPCGAYVLKDFGKRYILILVITFTVMAVL